MLEEVKRKFLWYDFCDMTDPDIVKYPYKKPDERGILDEELNIQRNNLLLTLVKI